MTQNEFRNKLRERIRDKTVLVGITAIVSEIIPTRRPTVASMLSVSITEATVWGSVKLYGYDAMGVGIDESLTFIANGTKTTGKIFKRLTKIECSGFTGGKIEIKTDYKDFDDEELNNVIAGALQEYAQYKPRFLMTEMDIITGNEYPEPTGTIWIRRIEDVNSNKISFSVYDGKFSLSGYEVRSWQGYLTPELSASVTNTLDGLKKFRVFYAVIPGIETITKDTELLLLAAEALCDRMKSEEPDRWVGLSTNVPGVEGLDISTEFRNAYESKMKEFRYQIGSAYASRN